MVIVNVFLIGLAMMSDIGIKPAIIQEKNIDSPDFLNTAWTLQVIRGIVLWIIICLLAYPAAQIYHQPQLIGLLFFTGSSAFFAGFYSINMILAERDLQLKKIVLIQLLTQLFSVLIMAVLALTYKSVWSLAIGTVLGGAMLVPIGHWVFSGHKHRLCFNVTYAKKIFHFGKWIFWGTLFTFFGGQGVRMIEGGFVTTEILGIISIAATLSWAMGELIVRFLGIIIFPALSQINRDSPERFPQALTKMRTIATLCALPAFGLLSFLSNFTIDLLYDERYSFAGPILAVLAINGFVRILPMFYQNALLAQGNSKQHFIISGATAFLSIAGLMAGFQLAGIFGMFMGSGIGFLASHFVAVFIVYKRGWVSLKFELFLITLIAVIAAISFSINLP